MDGRTEYALEGSVFIGGAVVQWLRDGLGLIRTAAEIEALAASCRTTAASTWCRRSPASARRTGIRTRAARSSASRAARPAAHIARAALESIAFQVADVLDAMAADCGIPARELRVDGGAAANNLLMQFQADLLGVPVVRPAVTETTALGAAYLAGLASASGSRSTNSLDSGRSTGASNRRWPRHGAALRAAVVGRGRAIEIVGNGIHHAPAAS